MRSTRTTSLRIKDPNLNQIDCDQTGGRNHLFSQIIFLQQTISKHEEKSFSYKRRKCVKRSNNKTSYFSFTDLKKQ